MPPLKRSRAGAAVDGAVVGEIARGLCVLVGVTSDDTDDDLDYVARKIVNTRLFDDAKGKAWSASVLSANLEVLCVSQVRALARTMV